MAEPEGGAPVVEPKGDTAPQPNPEPKKYAGKFETPEDMEKAYNELQKKLGSQTKVPDSGTDPNDIMAAPKPSEQPAFNDYADLVKSVGYTSEKVYEQFLTSGDVTDDFVNKVAKKMNVSKDFARKMAKTELGAIKSRNDAAMGVAVEAAGGQEQFDTLKNYLGTLPPDKQAAFRAAVNNPATTKFGIQSLLESYNESVGAGGAAPLAGGGTPSSSTAGYSNFAEYAAVLQKKAKGIASQAELKRLAATSNEVIDLANRPG